MEGGGGGGGGASGTRRRRGSAMRGAAAAAMARAFRGLMMMTVATSTGALLLLPRPLLRPHHRKSVFALRPPPTMGHGRRHIIVPRDDGSADQWRGRPPRALDPHLDVYADQVIWPMKLRTGKNITIGNGGIIREANNVSFEETIWFSKLAYL